LVLLDNNLKILKYVDVMFKIRFTFLCWVLMLPWLCPAAMGEPLTFGIVPQQSAQKLARNWGPVCAYLSEKTGIDIRFTTAPDIPEFERRLANSQYDIAYMNPYHYTVFCRNPGYIAFAKQKDKAISGIIVVHKDSPLQDCGDFAGKTLVFPSPAAFAASILTRAHFRNAGIPITPKYVKSHDSVYYNVAQGLFVAGGGVKRTFINTDPDVRKKLRIIWTTNEYTSHAIATHPRIASTVRDKVLAGLLMMNTDIHAKPLLEAIKFKGFAPATNEKWDDIRALGIGILEPLTGP
jgi:phosphonate transport system substrate-binding protein